jgi:hypothetical protein
MEKANKVLWRVRMQEQLDLATSAQDPEKAYFHQSQAMRFQSFAEQPTPPDCPLESES